MPRTPLEVYGARASAYVAVDLVREDMRRMAEPAPSAPIPGSTRDRVQRQADRMLPGIATPVKVPRERGAVAKAWGEALGAVWLAWALTRRKAWVRWGLRALTLALLLILAQPLLWAVTTPVCVVWNVAKMINTLERKADARKGVDKCTCGH